MNNAYYEYAQALFELAAEQNKEKIFLDSLSEIQTIFSEHEELFELLCSPAVSKAERDDVIDNVFEKSFDEHVVSFLKLLCENRRMVNFSDCVKEYENLYMASLNTVRAFVSSAFPLSEDEKLKLNRKLEAISGKSVIAEYSIDASLLGGVIVKMDGKIIDGSLKSRFDDVKDVVLK